MVTKTFIYKHLLTWLSQKDWQKSNICKNQVIHRILSQDTFLLGELSQVLLLHRCVQKTLYKICQKHSKRQLGQLLWLHLVVGNHIWHILDQSVSVNNKNVWTNNLGLQYWSFILVNQSRWTVRMYEQTILFFNTGPSYWSAEKAVMHVKDKQGKGGK